ncbi:BnaCnng15420D [Brassica napus]|uniref:ADP/ATP translocase n=2 Tax=Brassica napus TaxID=3708 RepID=A0A078ID03_BRANA|nr:BnaCnng15420D [Brassica napus]
MGIQEDPGAHSSNRNRRNPSSLPQTLKHFHRDFLAGAPQSREPSSSSRPRRATSPSSETPRGRDASKECSISSTARSVKKAVLRYYPSVALNFSLKDLYRNILRNSSSQENHRKDGVRGIYRGLPASLHGVIIHRGLYFGGFDTVKEVLSEDKELALWKRWVLAQGVTTSAGLASYPLDTVRRRIMMQSGIEHPMYSSTLDCWKKIYRVEGLASFYRGALSNMFRSTGSAAILVFYDEVKKFLNWGGI